MQRTRLQRKREVSARRKARYTHSRCLVAGLERCMPSNCFGISPGSSRFVLFSGLRSLLILPVSDTLYRTTVLGWWSYSRIWCVEGGNYLSVENADFIQFRRAPSAIFNGIPEPHSTERPAVS